MFHYSPCFYGPLPSYPDSLPLGPLPHVDPIFVLGLSVGRALCRAG